MVPKLTTAVPLPTLPPSPMLGGIVLWAESPSNLQEILDSIKNDMEGVRRGDLHALEDTDLASDDDGE